MKKLFAVVAQHLHVLNLVLVLLLVIFASFALGPLLPGVQAPVAPRISQKTGIGPRLLLEQEYFFMADPSRLHQEQWMRYFGLSLGESIFALANDDRHEKYQGGRDAMAPPVQDYLVVAEQNLFHPERRIPPLTAEVPRPEFVLYGTLVSDHTRIAYISDKKAVRSTPGRGNRQNSLKIGDSLSGYQLREVHHDHIVMQRGDDTMHVRVVSPGIKKERDMQKTGASVSAQGATSSASPASSKPSASSSRPTPPRRGTTTQIRPNP